MTASSLAQSYNFAEERERFAAAVAPYAEASVLLTVYDHLDVMRQQELSRAEQSQRTYKLHGLCAIVGCCDGVHDRYFHGLIGHDFFADDSREVSDPKAGSLLEKAMEEDGAILISSHGTLLHSGRFMYLNNRDELIKKPEYTHAFETYNHLRTTRRAGSRHASAIPLSAVEPGLFFFTLRSEDPEIRLFNDGYVLHSTLAYEGNHPALQKEEAPAPERSAVEGGLETVCDC
ncbi:MAG: hypothetical protein Q8R53_01085 [Nanoarchaeota archaeon]|nr:hypothetical protein [Nanoarchaeota archaeon]